MFRIEIVEEIKTHTLCSITFPPPPENRAVYELMWENNVESGRSQMTIWRMRNACWKTRLHAQTHNTYVILIAFPRQQWLHERTSMLRFRYTDRLVLILRIYDVTRVSNTYVKLLRSYLECFFGERKVSEQSCL